MTHARRRGPKFSARSSLGFSASRTDEVIRELERGLSFRSLKSFAAASGLPLSRISEILGIPERTLARRRSAARLAPDESERLFRLSRLFDQALELFEGDRATAVKWLTTPRNALAEHTPLEYSRTEVGARAVEDLIGRLEHGVFS
jgi:putative toxin-antitoxin system antitoxin component (TIGR02293 family)